MINSGLPQLTVAPNPNLATAAASYCFQRNGTELPVGGKCKSAPHSLTEHLVNIR